MGSSGVPGAGLGLIIGGDSEVWIADSQLSGGPAGYSFAAGVGLSVSGTSSVTVSNTTIPTGTFGPFVVEPLATAEWTTPGLTLGGTATATFRFTPATPVAVLLSSDFVPFSTPFFAEPLWVLATPRWAAFPLGMTDAQGEFSQSLTIPAVPVVQYHSLWMTGAFFGSLPFRSSAPLGGVIL